MKLDWKKTFLIGFGFLGTMVIWQLYNAFVPIFFRPAILVLPVRGMSLGFRLECHHHRSHYGN